MQQTILALFLLLAGCGHEPEVSTAGRLDLVTVELSLLSYDRFSGVATYEDPTGSHAMWAMAREYNGNAVTTLTLNAPEAGGRLTHVQLGPRIWILNKELSTAKHLFESTWKPSPDPEEVVSDWALPYSETEDSPVRVYLRYYTLPETVQAKDLPTNVTFALGVSTRD